MNTRTLRRAARLAIAVIMTTSMVAVVPPIASAAATTYYVDIAHGSDVAAGTSEATAWKTLDRAFEGPGTVPVAGDTVVLLPGTYSESNGDDFPVDFIAGVTLESKSGPSATIVDSEGGSEVLLQLGGVTANTVIRGITFRNDTYEHCISVLHDLTTDAVGWPLIEGNVFTGNDEPCIHLESVSTGSLGARIVDNEFYDNGDEFGHFADDGSCVYVTDGAVPTIQGNSFHDNYADDATVYTYGDSRASIVDNDFADNGAATNGAAIWVDNTTGRTSILDNLFRGNSAANNGGAVAADHSGEVIVSGNLFESNDSGQDGGAIATDDSTSTIFANVILGNASGDDAGGISLAGSHSTVVNNEIVANTCEGSAGAVDSSASDVDFFNNTVYGNVSTAASGSWNGIYHNGPGTFTISNSIVWGHEDEDAENTTIRYSCVETGDIALGGLGNTVGAGVIHIDPMFFDAEAGDMRLKVGSPCIDTASAADAPADDIEGTARPIDGDDDGTAVDDIGAWEHPTPQLARVAGLDRYATAAGIAKDSFDSSSIAVIASGQNFPDALSAAGLCGTYSAPLLLTRTDALPAVTSQTLRDLGVTHVIIVGGTGAVSPEVADALATEYEVRRIGGIDRYETSTLIAREIAAASGANFSKRAFIARGDMFPDALAVSPYAYSDMSPILLVRPTSVPDFTRIALEDLKVDQVFVCGGTGAVSDATKAAVDATIRNTTGNPSITSDRWGGADRYATAVAVADNATDEGFGTFDYVGVATGMNFPDALSGGVGAGVNSGVVLLTRTDALPKPTEDELAVRGPRVLACDIFGGEGAVAATVEQAVLGALGW